jgi:hypothetical protein
MMRSSRSSRNSGRNTKVTRRHIMEPETRAAGRNGDRPVPGKFSGLEPLTVDTPLTQEEVRRNPIFYELDLHPEQEDENLIIDVIYDNLTPMRMQDLYRGTDIPRGVRSGRTGSTSRPTGRCMTSTAAGFTRGPRESTRSRSGPPSGKFARWAGSGTSARPMAGTRARSSRSGLRRNRCSRMSCRPGPPSAGPGSCSGWSWCWPTFPFILLIVPVAILFLGSLRTRRRRTRSGTGC